MKRYGRRNVFTYVIFALIAIGILTSLANNFSQWIVPVIIFGLVFLLYRYPPKSWRNLANRYRPSAFQGHSAKSNVKNSKRAKFRVIRGNKPDDDNIPKYH
jgi:hypothetical protein